MMEFILLTILLVLAVLAGVNSVAGQISRMMLGPARALNGSG